MFNSFRNVLYYVNLDNTPNVIIHPLVQTCVRMTSQNGKREAEGRTLAEVKEEANDEPLARHGAAVPMFHLMDHSYSVTWGHRVSVQLRPTPLPHHQPEVVHIKLPLLGRMQHTQQHISALHPRQDLWLAGNYHQRPHALWQFM